MIIVFDLDDTLYSDASFVESGIKCVAKYLQRPKAFIELLELLQDSRDQVFDRYLKKHGIYTKKRVRELVQIYRNHTPHITLFAEAKRCLKRLSHQNLYLVTDGNYIVQQNKVKALKLEPNFKKIFYTSRYGLKHAKPSAYCFTKIASLEKVRPEDVVYVADNPHKDFVGIKPLGFRTVRVMTGRYAHVNLDRRHEAEVTITNLDELNKDNIAWLTL